MSPAYDVAIVGLGAMGSAAACHMARRGLRVVGFDRFSPPHDLGSSHGETRIIRVAYFEDPRYVPLVRRAWDLWLELEHDAAERLLERTGGLMIGPPDGALVTGALASATTHELEHEVLVASTLAKRFPAHRPAPEDVAVWEPMAGVLRPEACVGAHIDAALRAGAWLHTGEPVLSWMPDGEGVRVQTTRGYYTASQLLLTAGAWLPALMPEMADRLVVTRQPLVWFEPLRNAESFDAERFPIFIREHERDRYIYGFPLRESLVKVAIHMEGDRTLPDFVRRTVSDDEVERVRDIVRRCLPDAAGECTRRTVCMYTNTSDGHFRMGRHPEHPAVLVASCCSGHGFKFASAIGELFADLVTGKTPEYDLELFDPARA